jgi:hypothetical protein
MALPTPHKLPLHLRRGLLRIYIAVSVPWIAFFGYRFLDALQHPYQHHASSAFWSLLSVPVGGPISLLVVMWVLAGFRKSEQAASVAKQGTRARPSQFHPNGSPTDPPNEKSPLDYTRVGKGLGGIFFEPDAWHDMSKFREGDGRVARELAFVRVVIVKDAIRRLRPHNVAIQMSAEVDEYVASAFAKPAEAKTASIAIRLYEQHILSLAQLADVLGRRLSFSAVTAIDIIPLLETATAEAEQLLKVASAAEKLPRELFVARKRE